MDTNVNNRRFTHAQRYFHPSFICLIAGATLFAGATNMVQADEDRIPVGTVNGETIWLDDVMRQAERLPPNSVKPNGKLFRPTCNRHG